MLKGYEFYTSSGRTDLDPPPVGQTVAYFRSRAPEQMLYPEPQEAESPFGVSFVPEKLQYDSSIKTAPGIAGLNWTSLRRDGPPVLLASDMVSGQVMALDLRDTQRSVRRLAQLDNPCHIEPCDLDGDGNVGLLVADLGSRSVTDNDRGRVVWLQQEGQTGEFEAVVLASGLGRVRGCAADRHLRHGQARRGCRRVRIVPHREDPAAQERRRARPASTLRTRGVGPAHRDDPRPRL